MTNAQMLERFIGSYVIIRVSDELKLSPGDWLDIRHDKPPEKTLFGAEDSLDEFYVLANEARRSVSEAHASVERALGNEDRREDTERDSTRKQ